CHIPRSRFADWSPAFVILSKTWMLMNKPEYKPPWTSSKVFVRICSRRCSVLKTRRRSENCSDYFCFDGGDLACNRRAAPSRSPEGPENNKVPRGAQETRGQAQALH